jgi:hypothetical protein
VTTGVAIFGANDATTDRARWSLDGDVFAKLDRHRRSPFVLVCWWCWFSVFKGVSRRPRMGGGGVTPLLKTYVFWNDVLGASACDVLGTSHVMS